MPGLTNIYECPSCYVFLPYCGYYHNCQENDDDQGFFEFDDYLEEFLVYINSLPPDRFILVRAPRV
jgi:hypothetical protein